MIFGLLSIVCEYSANIDNMGMHPTFYDPTFPATTFLYTCPRQPLPSPDSR